MNVWITRHLQTLIGSLGRLSHHWFATSLTLMVIGIALALAACLQLLVDNTQRAAGNLHQTLSISVYLRQSTSVNDARKTADRVRQRRDVADVRLITAEEGLKEFVQESGFGKVLNTLNENPLPHALIVTPREGYLTTSDLDSLTRDLRALRSAQVVQLDTAWVKRLNAILEAARLGVLLVGALLAIGIVVIVGNTIRLDIQNRRDEIEITKLVGGSDGFVRRPFLYSGVWYGIGGGLIGWSITVLMVDALSGPVRQIAGLYSSGFELAGLGFKAGLALIAIGVFLGWLGSYIAASRHLRTIEPT